MELLSQILGLLPRTDGAYIVVGSYTFVVADPRLKDLENNMWSSSSRIIVSETGLQVESRIAKVVSATVY